MNDVVLDRFMSEFCGYGSLSADTWFVGLEEGGGHSEQEVAQRLATWAREDCRAVVDGPRFHEHAQLPNWFSPAARLQRTWRELIRIQLCARGDPGPSREDLRRVQARAWAREGGDNCLLELLPLPSPSTGDWHYGTWSQLPQLRSRRTYTDHYLGARQRLLRSLIETHSPRRVVFYGGSRLRDWCLIANIAFDDVHKHELPTVGLSRKRRHIHVASRSGTVFAVVPHPSRGPGSTAFQWIGHYLRP